MNVVDFLFEYPAPPGKIALIQGGQQISYEDLAARIDAMCGWLRMQGVIPATRCLICAENSPFWVASYLAIMKCGATAIPIALNIAESDLRSIVTSTSPAVAILQASQVARMDTVLPATCRVAVDRLPQASVASSLSITTEEQILTASYGTQTAYTDFNDREFLAALMFTSGSTGAPRGVKVTHRNIIANTTSIIESLGLISTDRAMEVLPLYYCFGASVLHTHLRVGGSVVMDNSFMFPDRVLKTMQQTACTVLAGVPSTFQLLLRKSSFKKMAFPSLRLVQQAGGKLADLFLDELRDAIPAAQVFVMYGQTEATARLACLPPEMYSSKRGSIGKGIPGVRLTVTDPAGNAVAPGDMGQIIAEGDNITAGYWNDPEETATVFRDGRLHTGDLATVDEDGYIYVVGREREFLKLGGNRVSCQQIENVILEFPGMSEAAVIGMADDIQGEAVLLFAAHPAGDAMRSELERFCVQRLPVHQRPALIIACKDLPRNASGKVDRPALKRGWRPS